MIHIVVGAFGSGKDSYLEGQLLPSLTDKNLAYRHYSHKHHHISLEQNIARSAQEGWDIVIVVYEITRETLPLYLAVYPHTVHYLTRKNNHHYLTKHFYNSHDSGSPILETMNCA